MTAGEGPQTRLSISGLERALRDDRREFRLTIPRLEIRAGERVALLGPNGSGKSTVLATLGLALAPTSAAEFRLISADGRPLDAAAAWARGQERLLADARAREIGFVLQQRGLAEFLTIGQSVEASVALAALGAPGPLDEIRQAFALDEIWSAYPGRLSGGQQQRAAFACALARRPALLLLDEPTSALDAAMSAQVMRWLARAAEDWGAAVVMSTQNGAALVAEGFRPIEVEVGGAPPVRVARLNDAPRQAPHEIPDRAAMAAEAVR